MRASGEKSGKGDEMGELVRLVSGIVAWMRG